MPKPPLFGQPIWIALFIFWVIVIGLVVTNQTVRDLLFG